MLLVLVFSIPANAQSEKGVSLDGHTFKADLDDSWVTTMGEMGAYNPEDSADPETGYVPPVAYDWTGTQDNKAFYHNDPSKLGWVDILVIKPKKDYVEENNASSSDILRHATDLYINPDKFYDMNAVTEKNIDFNGKAARLVEVENNLEKGYAGNTNINRNSQGAIAFFLDNGNVALIYVVTQKDTLGMRAWDVIDKISVE